MEMEKQMSCQPRNFFRCMVASSISIVLFLFYFRSSSFSTAPTTDLQSVVPISYLNSVSRDDTASPRPVRPLSGTINQTSAPNLIVRPHPPCTSSAPRVDPARPLPPTRRSDPCLGRYIYVYRLPSRFNTDMLKECKQSSKWSDVCYFTSNAGMGQALGSKERVFSKKGWFATNQFALDVIFHNRMKQYKCLTSNSSMASAIYVPFYAGLDIARYLWRFNISMRDATSLELVKWLAARPEWKVMGGRDHFMVGGRISWDFERQTNMESDWGNQLLLLPEVKNMTMLTIESSPYSSNDFSIPYPTYFHPSKDGEVFAWRDRMRRAKRPWLFAFAGARRPNSTRSIRDQIMDQCRDSKKAMLLQCDVGKKCHEPASIMKLFQSSVFCLQPQGDSYTRRSTFDAMVAGCIPVFFHPGSAYIQYAWHLPKNYESYSVFISENDVREGKVSIEKILAAIPPETVRAMREVVIGLIPRIIYADPKSRLEKLEDAFDLAVKGVIDKVERVRKGTKEGSTLDVGFEEKNIWKHRLVGHEGVHEWDPFFSH